MTHARSADAWRGALGGGALRIALPPFLASKLIGVLVPMATVWARSTGVGIPPASRFLTPFALWDGVTYTRIAAHGYPSGPLDLAPGSSGQLWSRFPGYPLLVHLVSYVVPQTVVAAIVVSAAAELVALYFLAKLILLERDGDEGSARFGCWALAVFPYAVYLTTAYTESSFLAASIAALYLSRRGRDGAAAVAAGAAIFIHVSGLALVPALAVEHLWRRRGRPGWGLVPIAASLVALLLFVLWAWRLSGDPLAYVHEVESASFDRLPAWPWSGASTTWASFTHGGGGNSFIFGMEMLFGTGALLGILSMALRWREIPASFTVYAAGVWVLSASVIYWLGMPRLMMTVAPFYLLLADLTRGRPRVRSVMLAASAGWMGFIAMLVATGQFVA